MKKGEWTRIARGVVVLMGLAAGSAVQAAAGDALGAVFRVDTDSTRSLASDRPMLARNAAGAFVVVWSGRDPSAPLQGWRLYARTYSPAGVPQGDPVPLFDRPIPVYRSLAMDGEGNFIVTWSDLDEGRSVIKFQRFDANAQPIGGAMPVANDARGARHAVAMNESGEFVVAWSQSTDVRIPLLIVGGGYGSISLGSSSVRARRFGADGVARGASLLVAASVTNPQPITGQSPGTPPSVDINATGEFVVAWPDRSLLREIVRLRRYDAQARPLDLLAPLAQATPPGSSPATLPAAQAPRVRLGDDGSVMLLYSAPHAVGSGHSGGDIYAHVHAPGDARGSASRISDHVGTSDPDVALTGDGRAISVWTDTLQPYCCMGGRVSFQILGADGSRIGGNTMVFDGTHPEYPAVASDAAGNFVLAWVSGGAQAVVQARMFAGY